ncbi:hypothetical protein [Vibrio mediterranei]|uniref:hypothetical protein n=1 Tax=Vibrio mediterranei TaxID=689 RepID=UPI004068FB00
MMSSKMDIDVATDRSNSKSIARGRLVLLALILFFAMPFIVAKAILTNNWYQSGVTNHGELIEPRVTFDSLAIENPLQEQSWQLGFVLPKVCEEECLNRLYIMGQTYLALGKYKERVTPVVYVQAHQKVPQLPDSIQRVVVNEEFNQLIPIEGYVIADTLGQLVMFFPPTTTANQVEHSKGLLSDLRKLLKLSRVG